MLYYLAKRNENTCPHKEWKTNIKAEPFIITFGLCPSTGEQVYKMWYILQWNTIQEQKGNTNMIRCSNMNEPQKHHTKWKNSYTKEMCYLKDSAVIYVWIWNWNFTAQASCKHSWQFLEFKYLILPELIKPKLHINFLWKVNLWLFNYIIKIVTQLAKEKKTCLLLNPLTRKDTPKTRGRWVSDVNKSRKTETMPAPAGLTWSSSRVEPWLFSFTSRMSVFKEVIIWLSLKMFSLCFFFVSSSSCLSPWRNSCSSSVRRTCSFANSAMTRMRWFFIFSCSHKRLAQALLCLVLPPKFPACDSRLSTTPSSKSPPPEKLLLTPYKFPLLLSPCLLDIFVLIFIVLSHSL